tara:strand:+ start:74 stop:697 length:624 start_codon:yes stop_codon:yes gene_type:complete
MEQKNENEFLMLKNYSNFLVELGLNVSFSVENNLKIKQEKNKKNLKSIDDIDRLVEEWQIKKNFRLMLRNSNVSSKILLLLSEESKCINFDQFKKSQLELLEKMFTSIGENIDNFFIINIDFSQMKESHIKKIKEILKLYFAVLAPKIFINMSSDNLDKFLVADKLNFNFSYFKIPSVSNIIKNQSLKRDAWTQLKLLKEKLNAFYL